MTREEVKREQRESEGDPRTKEARARARDERLASAAVANVRAATIVVVDAARVACALRYDAGDGDAAPVLVASGEGDAAERIARAARDHGVPVVQDAALARRLGELAIGEAIPEALYEAVAEVLRDAPARG
jgi:type III secretion protein U